MKIATWNVNSIRARLPRVVSWLERRQPDIACFQETKVVDELFPAADLEALGYHCQFFGQKTYNGVAILTREEAVDVVRNLPSDGIDFDRRLLAATVGNVRVINIYAPNGREVGHPMYDVKLDWYSRLRTFLDENHEPAQNVILCGDFNIAPDDRDVWDPSIWKGKILCSDPERAVFGNLIDWGMVDTLRMHHSDEGLFTWWDYRGGAFHRKWGMRIDHILASSSLAEKCTVVEIDRDERKGPKPSDHAPLMATLDLDVSGE